MELPLPPRLIPGTAFCIVCEDVSNTSLHAFPKKPADRQKWLQVLNLTEESLINKPKAKVCAYHFHRSSFSKSATSIPRLLPGALPNRRPYHVERPENVPTTNKTADPTLPVMDDSTFLIMPTASDIENISQTIVSTIPIADDYSFLTLPTGIDLDICNIMDGTFPLLKEYSPLLSSSSDAASPCFNVESTDSFASISKYSYSPTTTKQRDYSTSTDPRKNLELALKTIEKHKKTIKRLQQTNRQLQKRIIELEMLKSVKTNILMLDKDG